MKHCFLVLASALLLLTNCSRKQNLAEPERDEKIAEYARTCYNGVKDGDETFIDCGGICGPCKEAVPTCATANKSIVIEGNATYSVAAGTCSLTSYGKYIFSGTLVGGGSYEVILGTAIPNVTEYYKISGSPVPNDLEDNEAYVSINPASFSLASTNSGKVFISQVSGVYYATICESVAWSTGGWSTAPYRISGKVSCQ